MDRPVRKEIEDYPLTLRPEDVQEILRVSRSKAYDLFHRTDFPALKIPGKLKRVQRDAFFKWMENGCTLENNPS